MKDHFYKLFQGLPHETISKEAFDALTKKIALLERRVVVVRRVLLTLVTGTFLLVFIPTGNFLLSQFAESTFFSYASLLASDSDVALLNTKEFLYSLIESLPIFGITLTLTLVFILLGAMSFAANKSRKTAEFLTTRIA